MTESIDRNVNCLSSLAYFTIVVLKGDKVYFVKLVTTRSKILTVDVKIKN